MSSVLILKGRRRANLCHREPVAVDRTDKGCYLGAVLVHTDQPWR